MFDDSAQPPFTTLTLPSGTFEALARGDVDQAAVRALLDAERSRRLLLLHHILTRVRRSPALLAPLPDITGTEALLDDVEELDPRAFDEVLALPQVGMWLAATVRRLEAHPAGPGTVPADPLWVQLGRVAALAASAAVRSRISFEIALPAVQGQVFLPGLGRADLGSPEDASVDPHQVALLRADGAGIELRMAERRLQVPYPLDLDRSGWTAMPMIETKGAGGRVLKVHLDHLDPAPSGVGLPPRMVPVASQWHRRVAEAWQLLDADHPAQAEVLAIGLRTLLPLTSDGATVLGGSSAEGFGAAALCLPATVVDLACLFVHEFQHSVLNGLLHLVDLCGPDPDGAVHYAPWRSDPRPLIGLLHGAYAFTAVTAFWQDRRTQDGGQDARRAELEFAHWRLQTSVALDQLALSRRLSPLGERVVTGLRERVAGWLAEPVAAEAERLAVIAARAHRAAWQSHHITVPTPWVDTAVRSWHRGGVAPVPEGDGVSRDVSACGLDRVFLLARHAYTSSAGPLPHSLRAALADDPQAADQALVRGDTATARDRYLAEITADPGDPHPWGGLGPALYEAASAATPRSGAGELLVEHPERVRAVYRTLRADTTEAPDVVELANWLAAC